MILLLRDQRHAILLGDCPRLLLGKVLLEKLGELLVADFQGVEALEHALLAE